VLAEYSQRGNVLLQELHLLETYAKEQEIERFVELRGFRSDVQNLVQSTNKVMSKMLLDVATLTVPLDPKHRIYC
jgi:hypothetical protein